MKVKVKLQKSDPCKKIVAPSAALITPLPPVAADCRQKASFGEQGCKKRKIRREKTNQ